MAKKKIVSLALASIMVMSSLAACSSKNNNGESASPSPSASSSSPASTDSGKKEDKLKFSVFYSDNATLPFKEDWLVVQEVEKRFNVDIDFEVIPIADYQTKVSLALNT